MSGEAAPSTQPDFSYAPLPPADSPGAPHIRLFHLRAGEPSEPIRGELEVVSVAKVADGPGSFDAISYLWGNPTPTSAILCDDGSSRLPIAENLSNALASLRPRREVPRSNFSKALDKFKLKKQRASPESLVLWIDAICINQNDLGERSSQVQLMRRIYQGAATVRIYLDETVNPNTKAFKLIHELVRKEDWREGSGSLEDFHDAGLLVRYGIGAHPPEFWEPIGKLLSNPFFVRVWIQQEVLLARNLWIHCRNGVEITGNAFLLFQDAASNLNLIDYRLLASKSDQWYNLDMSRFGWVGTPRLFDSFAEGKILIKPLGERDEAHGKGIYSELLSLVNVGAKLETTNPHDRVYALIGLAADYEEGDIVVDYTLPMPFVYASVVNHFVNRYRTLDFLSWTRSRTVADRDHANQAFPSWLHNLGVAIPWRDPDDLDFESSGATELGYHPLVGFHSNAARSECLALRVAGFRIARVEASTEQGLNHKPADDLLASLLPLFPDSNGGDDSVHIQRCLDVFLALLAEYNPEIKKEPDEQRYEMLGQVDTLLPFCNLPLRRKQGSDEPIIFPSLRELCKAPADGRLRKKWGVNGKQQYVAKRLSRPSVEFLDDVLTCSLLIRCIGEPVSRDLGNATLIGTLKLYDTDRLPLPGDEVWLLFGYSVLLVLRRCETRREFEEGEDGPGATGNDVYIAIGYAVLPGAMRGEYVQGIGLPGYRENHIRKIDIA